METDAFVLMSRGFGIKINLQILGLPLAASKMNE